jgi:hypothetical protein
MKRIYQSFAMALMLMISALGFSGCYVDTCHTCTAPPPPPPCSYGPNGVPGPAFFGLDWTGVQPSYLWTNNTAIPPVFAYGSYYNSFPGSYRLYYEGSYYAGCCLTEFHWDVDFLVWVNAGTAGGCGFAGADGLPSYLMLVCGPNGPGDIRTNKMASAGVQTTVISQTDDEVILQHVKGDINVRITYKRLKESLKDSLDPSGTIKSE